MSTAITGETVKVLDFWLVLHDEIAASFTDPNDEFYVYDGEVTWALTVVRVGSEWRLEASSFCGFLTQLERYFTAIAGSAIPNRTPLDACTQTYPQSSVGSGPTLPTDG